MAQGRSCSPTLLLLLLLLVLADDITSAGCAAGTLSRYWLMNCRQHGLGISTSIRHTPWVIRFTSLIEGWVVVNRRNRSGTQCIDLLQHAASQSDQLLSLSDFLPRLFSA